MGKKVLEQVLIISGRKMGYGKLCYMYLMFIYMSSLILVVAFGFVTST